MMKQHRFRTIVEELTRLNAEREEAMLMAFAVLEKQDAALAVLITQNVGDRVRAARWMCRHHAPSAAAPLTKRWPMAKSIARGIEPSAAKTPMPRCCRPRRAWLTERGWCSCFCTINSPAGGPGSVIRRREAQSAALRSSSKYAAMSSGNL